MIHLMVAPYIDDKNRPNIHDTNNTWKLAPKADAILDYWTPTAIGIILQLVNDVWNDAKIHFSLRRVDKCEYTPETLRLDGRLRESMFTPESQVPWAPQLFRSINRVFTIPHTDVIHIVVWWSIREDDVSRSRAAGYARSAAFGGPVVWTDVYMCLQFGRGPKYGHCAIVVAHEIGHALGLQHVDAKLNLMYNFPTNITVSPKQVERVRREVQQQFRR